MHFIAVLQSELKVGRAQKSWYNQIDFGFTEHRIIKDIKDWNKISGVFHMYNQKVFR